MTTISFRLLLSLEPSIEIQLQLITTPLRRLRTKQNWYFSLSPFFFSLPLSRPRFSTALLVFYLLFSKIPQLLTHLSRTQETLSIVPKMSGRLAWSSVPPRHEDDEDDDVEIEAVDEDETHTGEEAVDTGNNEDIP